MPLGGRGACACTRRARSVSTSPDSHVKGHRRKRSKHCRRPSPEHADASADLEQPDDDVGVASGGSGGQGVFWHVLACIQAFDRSCHHITVLAETGSSRAVVGDLLQGPRACMSWYHALRTFAFASSSGGIVLAPHWISSSTASS